MRRAYKPPSHSEDQQGQYAISKIGVPLHSIAAKIDANYAASNAEHQ